MLGRGGEGGACVAPDRVIPQAARANSASHLGTFGARLTWLAGARASGMGSGVSKRTVAAGVSVVQPVCENIALGVVWLTLPFGTRTLDKGAGPVYIAKRPRCDRVGMRDPRGHFSPIAAGSNIASARQRLASIAS